MNVKEFRIKYGTKGASVILEVLAEQIRFGRVANPECAAKLLEDLAKDLESLQ